jgi:hypothetical protein
VSAALAIGVFTNKKRLVGGVFGFMSDDEIQRHQLKSKYMKRITVGSKVVLRHP